MTTEPKVPLRERRFKKALAAIERTKKRREAAIRTLTKCEALLPKLERQARRLGAPPRPPKMKLDDKPPATLPTIEPEVKADGIPDFLRRGQAAQKAVDAVIAAVPKPKRRMSLKQQAKELSAAADALTPTGMVAAVVAKTRTSQADRAKRMEAMGFRPTKRR